MVIGSLALAVWDGMGLAVVISHYAVSNDP